MLMDLRRCNEASNNSGLHGGGVPESDAIVCDVGWGLFGPLAGAMVNILPFAICTNSFVINEIDEITKDNLKVG